MQSENGEKMKDHEKFIVDNITKMAGKYTPYRIFTDWITMYAISIQNSCQISRDKIFMEREEMYKTIAIRYSSDELKIMAHMGGALCLALEERFSDVLGDIFMKSGCGSKNTGQFFTPYHLSYLTAKLVYEADICTSCKNGVYEVNEPSCGGGGMMIAIAKVMQENNIDFQKKLHIVAQDLDWNGVYMTYIQLSLLGIKAIVVQGDTLMKPYRKGYDERNVFRTPAEMGMII